jgi:hypothetical protein
VLAAKEKSFDPRRDYRRHRASVEQGTSGVMVVAKRRRRPRTLGGFKKTLTETE